MASALQPALGDRSLFPDLADRVYVNHGAISPPSLPVRHAVAEVLGSYAALGAGAFPRWAAQRAELRAKLGILIGVQGEDIALMPNTTSGMVGIALCFPWQRGDRVILFEGEFPANVTPWQRAAEMFGLTIGWVPVSAFAESHEAGMARLQRELERGARLAAVSAVQFQTGLRMPVAEMAALCHAAGAELFVDAVQACGAVPLDAGGAGLDYVAAGAHKWLMGIEGTGFLYVRRERAEALRPNLAGWLSHEDALGFLFRGPGLLRYDRPIKKRASLFEGGNSSAAGLAGLEASLDLLLALGVPAIFAHVNAILDVLEAGLSARGFQSLRSRDARQRSCTLSLVPPRGVGVVELHRRLGAHGVACSIPDGLLRLTPHWPNREADAAHVLEAVDASLAELGC